MMSERLFITVFCLGRPGGTPWIPEPLQIPRGRMTEPCALQTTALGVPDQRRGTNAKLGKRGTSKDGLPEMGCLIPGITGVSNIFGVIDSRRYLMFPLPWVSIGMKCIIFGNGTLPISRVSVSVRPGPWFEPECVSIFTFLPFFCFKCMASFVWLNCNPYLARFFRAVKHRLLMSKYRCVGGWVDGWVG